MSNYNSNNNNSGNSEKTTRSTSTKGIHLINPRQEIPCALDITYYDDMVRVQFAPELPANKQTENRRYDYENSVMTALTRAKCNELCNAYENVIRPAIINCEDASVSITLAGVNVFQIGTGVVDGAPHPYLCFCKDINPNTLVSPKDKRLKYEFNTGEYILGYNPETGEFKERVITCNEIDLFFHDMKNIRDASSNAYVHTDRVVNRYTKDTLDNKINRIGEKMGLDLSTKSRYSKGNGGRGSIFDTASSVTDQNSNATTITSIDDIDAMMAQQLG